MKDLRISFIGKIISCYTHEMKNYLAIIKETNGLMKDVIQIGKSRSFDAKNFMGFVGTVEEQICRATALTDYLYRFAHRMESELASVNINDLIDELVALVNRLAYRKRISFKKDLNGGMPDAKLNPLLFHYFIFCLIDRGMSDLDRNSVILVGTSYSNGCFRISLLSDGTIKPQADPCMTVSDEELEQLASELGAVILQRGNETVITIPA
jgi:hypothetical protein